MMRKTAAFILLLVFLDASPASRQLFKIPLLLVHYHDHQHKNPGISFWQYLKLHYQGENDNGKDEAQDQQLPFKSAVDGGNPLYISAARITAAETPEFFVAIKQTCSDDNISPGTAPGIFHPPKPGCA